MRRLVCFENEGSLTTTISEIVELDEIPRIMGNIIVPDLKVEVNAGRVARHPHLADDLPFGHLVTAANKTISQVGIIGSPTVTVIDDDQFSIAIAVPPSEDDNTRFSGIDRRIGFRGKIYAGMPQGEFLGNAVRH